MGQCFLYGNGGKDRLKLRIFGQTTPPPNPKNNDIWVNTSLPIGGWEFSEISNPTWGTGISGFVYFTCTMDGASGSSASTGLNFLKEWTHAIYTKLLSCSQYDGSSWPRKDAYIYHDKWIQFSSAWDGTLFYNGNQYTDITGGWTGANSYSPNLSATLYSGTITISTASAVDLSGFSTLKFMGSGNGANSGGTYSAKCKIVNESGVEVASLDFQSSGTYAVSVAALSGKHYVRFVAAGSRGNNLDISKVWLE